MGKMNGDGTPVPKSKTRGREVETGMLVATTIKGNVIVLTDSDEVVAITQVTEGDRELAVEVLLASGLSVLLEEGFEKVLEWANCFADVNEDLADLMASENFIVFDREEEAGEQHTPTPAAG